MPPVRPMKNVTPPDPNRARLIGMIVLGFIVVLLCVLFPRVLAFTELAARELRYLWWLVLLVALGVYFFFFFGRKKD
jgi:apolipoprotein N-acyltransferase